MANPISDPMFVYQFRVILIGDSKTGKSCLIRKLKYGKFAEDSSLTVGVDFFLKRVKVSDGKTIKLQIWDTAGQEKFRPITRSYYRNCVGVVLVYDICSRKSYDNILGWKTEAERHIEPYEPVFLLVGCKSDLAADDPTGDVREVQEVEAKKFAALRDIDFFETSAKTGYQVQNVFRFLSQTICDKINTGEYGVGGRWNSITFCPEYPDLCIQKQRPEYPNISPTPSGDSNTQTPSENCCGTCSCFTC